MICCLDGKIPAARTYFLDIQHHVFDHRSHHGKSPLSATWFLPKPPPLNSNGPYRLVIV